MTDRGVDLSTLPKEVRDQLAELDLELSEGRLDVPAAGSGALDAVDLVETGDLFADLCSFGD